MNVIPYVIDFLEYCWTEISSVTLTFLNGLSLGSYLFGLMVVTWGIGIYTYFVNGFMADTSSIRAEINANKPKSVVNENRSTGYHETNTSYQDKYGVWHTRTTYSSSKGHTRNESTTYRRK